MKDEYVMQHFPLPDGEGNESEEEHPVRPELAVNVTNGNLVYRQQDVEVTGPAVDLEVERFYNSQLPAEDNTQWGDGWTLAQTPKLEFEETKEEAPPAKASMVRTSGALESTVGLPTESGGTQFDKRLQAVVTKEAGGGYEVEDQSGETDTSLAFDKAGKVQELQTPGSAKIDYSYEAGDLTEMAVDDPGTASGAAERAVKEPPLHAATFSSHGKEPGQLSEPSGLTVDGSGNVWVADTMNGRLQEFKANGEFIRTAGSIGTGAGQFGMVEGVAIDSKGNVWATDTNQQRIEEFSSTGTFLKMFGWGVSNGEAKFETCTASCHQGIAGSGNGQFSYPSGIVVDSKGNVFVADRGNKRVQELSETGTWIRNISQAKEEEGPFGVALDAVGNLWVSYGFDDKIAEFTSEGSPIRSWGAKGTGAGQLEGAYRLTVGPEGNIWVAEYANNRVQVFTTLGEYLFGFGSAGSGEGQFSHARGIAISGSTAYALDSGNFESSSNNRVETWVLSNPVTYAATFSSHGKEPGQLSEPSGLTVDGSGNVWVADTMNGRLQEFKANGEFIRTAGSIGTGAGQFGMVEGVAIDSKGNVWATDTNQQRIEEFSSTGTFLKMFGWGVSNGEAKFETCTASCHQGIAGSGNGQFSYPSGIVVDSKGNVFVADRGNKRVQELSETGTWIRNISQAKEEEGPFGVALDAVGNLWVSYGFDDKIAEFTSEGSPIRSWGAKGTGAGQLEGAYRLTVGPEGNIWVAEYANNRVQVFTTLGEYLFGFGSAGSGEGQFSHARGIAISGSTAYALDSGNFESSSNNRVERWTGFSPPPIEPNPEVEVNVSSGLVTSVEGEAAGTTTYSHSGEMLTAVTGPKGKANYEYDEAKRLKKVSLPNGTWGEVHYDAYGRVESVTVSVEGAKAKKTTFTYKDEPRRTTVSPEGEPATIYDIAPDGSVLKWWNTAVAPEIENLSGSLYANKETEKPIEPGDYELLVQAFAAEGIASIQVVANGSQLVDEKTCEKTKETSCKTVEDPWVTNTGNWPPGILQLEVIVTDANHNTESAKFWVNIPYTPPPNPEVEEPPTFEEVLHFREEFGLDLDLKGNEIAIDERIFNLIGDWYNPNTPPGEVARASDQRWGVPLRPVDVAELEYRESYIAQAASAIPAWAEAHAPSSYAGYYVSQREGGIIHVGFTSGQAALVGELKAQAGLIAPGRVQEFIGTPSSSLHSLGTIMGELSSKLQGRKDIVRILAKAAVNVKGNILEVTSTDPTTAKNFITEAFGSTAPIAVTLAPSKPVLKELPRSRPKDEKLYGGDWIEVEEGFCSVGFGASEQLAKKPNQESTFAHFALTAGHCAAKGSPVSRVFKKTASESGKYGLIELGRVARRSYGEGPNFFNDGEAIRLESGIETPKGIYLSSKRAPVSVKGVEPFVVGSTLCTSGSYSGYHCGVATEPFIAFPEEEMEYVVETTSITTEGDSGGSVWDSATGKAVGLVEGGYAATGPTWMTPLLPVPLPGGAGTAPGLLEQLDASGGGPFNIVRGSQ